MRTVVSAIIALLSAPLLSAQIVSSASIVDSIVGVTFVGGSNYSSELVLFRADGTYQDISMDSHFSGGGTPTSPPQSGTYSYSVSVGTGWQGPQTVGTIAWTSGTAPRQSLTLWFQTPTEGQPGASGPGVLSTFSVSPRSALTGAVNVSNNAWISASHPTTPGFVIEGNRQRWVLIRGAGPALAQFGVASPLASPQLTLFAGGGASEGDVNPWSGDPNLVPGLQAIFSVVGAFPFQIGSSDCAGLFLLLPGAYTVQGVTPGPEGEVLIEIYILPYGS